jgi:hypothetical protein
MRIRVVSIDGEFHARMIMRTEKEKSGSAFRHPELVEGSASCTQFCPEMNCLRLPGLVRDGSGYLLNGSFD